MSQAVGAALINASLVPAFAGMAVWIKKQQKGGGQ
jgi:hypothetical protein